MAQLTLLQVAGWGAARHAGGAAEAQRPAPGRRPARPAVRAAAANAGGSEFLAETRETSPGVCLADPELGQLGSVTVTCQCHAAGGPVGARPLAVTDSDSEVRL